MSPVPLESDFVVRHSNGTDSRNFPKRGTSQVILVEVLLDLPTPFDRG